MVCYCLLIGPMAESWQPWFQGEGSQQPVFIKAQAWQRLKDPQLLLQIYYDYRKSLDYTYSGLELLF